MEVRSKEINSTGVKLFFEKDGKEIARGYLYLLNNDLHSQPYGFMEDVFVVEEFRGQGYGTKIIKSIIEEAKKLGCYKLLGTSRHGREKVHEFYKSFGFYDRGIEFRMDL